VTDSASRWGLRALAVAGALLIWFFVSVEKRERTSQKVIDASVTYNLPAGTILLDPVQSVKVRLRGPDRQLRSLSPFAVDVVVDATDLTASGLESVHLTATDVLLPDGIEVVSLEPNTLSVRLDIEVQRTLPVVPRIVGEPAGGAVPGDIRAVPETAIVRGPEGLLATLDTLTTSPVSLDGHAFSFEQRVSIVPSDPLVRVIQPGAVTVLVPMHNPDTDALVTPSGASPQ